MTETQTFDLAIHLCGEQSIPNLIGIRDVPAERHILLVSDKSEKTFQPLEKIERPKKLEPVLLRDPFDMIEVRKKVEELCQTAKGNVAINLTGGTKPMAFGAWMGGAKTPLNATFFYYDSQNNRRFQWSAKTPITRSEIPKFLVVEDFINLSAFKMLESSVDMNEVERRKELTLTIWKYRDSFQEIQSQAQKTLEDAEKEAKKRRSQSIYFQPFCLASKNSLVEMDFDGDRVQSLTFDRRDFPNVGDLADLSYYAGRWFEEFVYWTLEPLQKSGEIKEMRLGLKTRFDSSRNPSQEFDLLITDGLRLYVLECKAGFFGQDNLQKLENISKNFGGAMGLGVLVARHDQSQNRTAIERTLKSQNFACLHGGNLADLLPRELFRIKAGEIIPDVNRQ